MKTPITPAEYREEARSLKMTAERVQDAAQANLYYEAASRCARVANLIDRGLTREDATAFVLKF